MRGGSPRAQIAALPGGPEEVGQHSPPEPIAALLLRVSTVTSSAATVAVVELGACALVLEWAAVGPVRTRAERDIRWLRRR